MHASGSVTAAPGAEVAVAVGDSVLRPMMWMFLAILATFIITRTVTRLIRSGQTRLLSDLTLASTHIHHQVFGILLLIGTGIVLISATPQGAALNIAAAVFGVGTSLTLDEFALWLHLQDVYWSREGRKSVDAIFCVLAVTGVLIGGADFLSGTVGTATWWVSVAGVLVNLALSVTCVLKGKIVTGVIGMVLQVVGLIGAIRLAKPGSWWSTHRYRHRPRALHRSQARFDDRYEARWNRVRDLVAGAPEP